HPDTKGIPDALRLAELLFPHHDGLRHSATQWRHARQARLPGRYVLSLVPHHWTRGGSGLKFGFALMFTVIALIGLLSAVCRETWREPSSGATRLGEEHVGRNSGGYSAAECSGIRIGAIRFAIAPYEIGAPRSTKMGTTRSPLHPTRKIPPTPPHSNRY